MQSITRQTLLNLVDMFKSEMNFKSNLSKTGLTCIEINPQSKKIKIRQVFKIYLHEIHLKDNNVYDFKLTSHTEAAPLAGVAFSE